MIAVKIKVSGVVLTAEQPVVTSGSCGTVRLEFEFDSEWNGFSKTAVFYTARGNVFVTLSDSACEFPQEALCAAGDVKVGVFGTDGEKTLTSLLCKVRVSQGTSKDAERAANYVPGIYEQLYAKLDKVENLSVTAVSGDEAAGVLKETDGVLTLSLTLPRGEQGEKGEQGDKGDKGDTGADGHSPEKGVDYLTQAEIDKFLLEYFYYWNADGEAWMPLLSGMLCFETDEDFENWNDKGLEWNEALYGGTGNILIVIGGVPRYIRVGEIIGGEPTYNYMDFKSPMLDSEKEELKAYTDEKVGDIETALDEIIALQEAYIGGDGE